MTIVDREMEAARLRRAREVAAKYASQPNICICGRKLPLTSEEYRCQSCRRKEEYALRAKLRSGG